MQCPLMLAGSCRWSNLCDLVPTVINDWYLVIKVVLRRWVTHAEIVMGDAMEDGFRICKS